MKPRTRQWLKEKGKPVGRHLTWNGEEWELGSPGPAEPNREERRRYLRFAMAQYVRGCGIKRRRRKLGKNGFNPRRMSSKL